MEFGKYLAQLRKDRGLTQEQLETLSGVSRDYIASLELGRLKKPSTAHLLKLAKGLRRKPEEFYVAAGYIKDYKNPKEEKPIDLIRSIRADLHRLEKMVNFTEQL